MNRDFWVGAGIAGFGLLLLVAIIPTAVDSPKAVRSIVLSPVFWPNIVSALLILGGLVLAATAYWKGSVGSPETPRFPMRLLAISAMMTVYVAAISSLGMVWSSMLAFAAFLLIGRSRNPVSGIVTAVALPLALYAFFYHVAGVAVPQGVLVRLP